MKHEIPCHVISSTPLLGFDTPEHFILKLLQLCCAIRMWGHILQLYGSIVSHTGIQRGTETKRAIYFNVSFHNYNEHSLPTSVVMIFMFLHLFELFCNVTLCCIAFISQYALGKHSCTLALQWHLSVCLWHGICTFLLPSWWLQHTRDV